MNFPTSLKKSDLALAGILGLALFLRLVGIQFGLPHLYHADEPMVVNHALAYGMGDFNPHYFKLPPLVSYLLFFCYGIFYLVARLGGWIHSVNDFQGLFLADPSIFYLLGRLVFGVGLGTLTVLVFYLVVNRFFSKVHAYGASLLLAVNFLHVQNSHYLYLDIPLLGVIVASLFPILRILESHQTRDYLIFGFLHGLAVGVKYNGFFIIVPFLAAHLLSHGRVFQKYLSRDLWLAGSASLLTFLAVNPFAWLDSQAFRRDFLSMHEYEGKLGWTHHLVYSLQGAFDVPSLLLAFLGIGSVFLRPKKNRLVLLSFLLAYYAVLANFSEQHSRYVLPLVPFIIFFVVDGVYLLASKLIKSQLLFTSLIFLLSLPPLIKVCRCNWILAQEDVRTVATKWVEEHIPAGSRIALDSPFFMPRLLPSLNQLEEKMEEALRSGHPAQQKRLAWLIRDAKTRPVPRYELYYLNKKPTAEFLFVKPVVPYDVECLKEAGVEYVFVVRLREGHFSAFYEELGRTAVFIKRFSPYKDPKRKWPISKRPLTGAPFLWSELAARERNGQIIEIYHLKSHRLSR